MAGPVVSFEPSSQLEASVALPGQVSKVTGLGLGVAVEGYRLAAVFCCGVGPFSAVAGRVGFGDIEQR